MEIVDALVSVWKAKFFDQDSLDWNLKKTALSDGLFVVVCSQPKLNAPVAPGTAKIWIKVSQEAVSYRFEHHHLFQNIAITSQTFKEDISNAIFLISPVKRVKDIISSKILSANDANLLKMIPGELSPHYASKGPVYSLQLPETQYSVNDTHLLMSRKFAQIK